MCFPKSIAVTIAVALAMVGAAGPAMARSYSGSYPVTVTHSQRSNGTDCLTLTQSSRHGGSASLVAGSSKLPYGTFQIINHFLVVTIQQPGYGQNAGLVFVAPAAGGHIGSGIFEQVYGGADFDSGALAFGTKGGC